MDSRPRLGFAPRPPLPLRGFHSHMPTRHRPDCDDRSLGRRRISLVNAFHVKRESTWLFHFAWIATRERSFRSKLASIYRSGGLSQAERFVVAHVSVEGVALVAEPSDRSFRARVLRRWPSSDVHLRPTRGVGRVRSQAGRRSPAYPFVTQGCLPLLQEPGLALLLDWWNAPP